MEAATTATAGASGSASVRRREWLAALLLYLAMGVVLLAGAWRDFGNIGGKDWNAFLGQEQAELTSLLDYGQFPAWNPWRAGGQVSFAQPQSMFLSPITPVALFTGANAAFKLWLLPLFVLGAMGMYALAGWLGLRGVARLVPGAVFFGSSVFPLYVTGGVPHWYCAMTILPWLFLLHRKSVEDHRYVAAAAAAYAAVLCCGSLHHFVLFPVVFGLDAVLLALSRRGLRPLLTTAAWGLAGVALATVLVVPLLDLFREFPRELPGLGRWMPLELLPRVLFSPDIPDLHGRTAGLLVFGGSAVYWVNCGAYIGLAAGLLALLGVVGAPRRTAGLFLLTVGCTWLALGNGIHPSLWDAVHRLPVLSSMQAPERLMMLVVFGLALLAGVGFALVELALASRAGAWTRVASGALLAAVIVPLLVVNRSIVEAAFTVPPPAGVAPTTLLSRGAPRPPFQQGRIAENGDMWGGPLYEAVLRNVGNPEATSQIPAFPAVQRAGDPGYRGEAYLANGRGRVTAEITPNRLRVTGELTADDRLVVNQAFFPGWRATGTVRRDAEPHKGLLSLPLPAGRHDVLLEFAPAAIPLGFALEGVALAIVVAWGVARRAHATRAPQAAGAWLRSDGLALASLAAVVVAVGAWHALSEPHSLAPPPSDWRTAAITVGGSDDLQAALDAAPPGAVIRVTAGAHRNVRLHRAVTLIADPIGSVELGEAAIESLPANETAALLGFRCGSQGGSGQLTIERCAGTVVLQSFDWAGEGRALRAAGAEHVLLVASWLQELAASDSRVVLIRSEVAAGAISASGSVLLLQESRVQAAPGQPAIRLERSQLTLSSSGEVPSLELQHASTALISAADVRAISQRCDADSRVTIADPRLPAIHLDANVQAGVETDATITGPPGAKGTLIVATAPRLVAVVGQQFLQADLDRTTLLLPFELPASGRTAVRVPAGAPRYAAGSAVFVQLMLPAGEDGASKLYSLADGSLIEPPREAP